MEYLSEPEDSTKSRILCCNCGIPVEPNPANMCIACLRSQVDITQGIPKQATLHFCRGCERYLQPPAEWVHCALESRELLSLCLKKLKGLNHVKLIDASFIWTEPHSKRIKVKLTVHGEVIGGTTLQQVFVVEYTVAYQMCTDCHRSEAKDYWRASVQVRQKGNNKKTLYYLEQLILKHKSHVNTLGIKPIHGGLDFYYTTEGYARKMVDFLNSVLPCRCQHSKKLISHDIHSNVYNYKFTYSVEIVPISKDSVVCLPKKLTQQFGGISPLCLIYRITNSIHLIDPSTAQIAELGSILYWRSPFGTICDPRQLVEYIVMDIEPILEKQRNYFPGQGLISTHHVLADVWIVKSSELGINTNTVHTRTHLGHILKIGDSVLGYSLRDTNINDDNFEKLDKNKCSEVILVKKYYGDRGSRRRQRIWKLKRLAEDEAALDTDGAEYDEFLDDIEEDPDLRQNINIYKDTSKQIPPEEDFSLAIPLKEMLDLTLEDVEMEET